MNSILSGIRALFVLVVFGTLCYGCIIIKTDKAKTMNALCTLGEAMGESWVEEVCK